MRLITLTLALIGLGILTLPRRMSDEVASIGGVWCNRVGWDTECPAPEINGGGNVAALCAAENVTSFRIAWPGDTYNVLNSNLNCTKRKVGFTEAPCGHLPLASPDECLAHVAWLPW
jgi:hypothetical protein